MCAYIGYNSGKRPVFGQQKAGKRTIQKNMPATEPHPNKNTPGSENASLEQVLQKARRTLWVFYGLDLVGWLFLSFSILFGALILCVAFWGMPFETPFGAWACLGGALASSGPVHVLGREFLTRSDMRFNGR